MYAIVKTGGKQYKAEPNETIRVEKLEGQPGDTVELNEVLMICDDKDLKLGSPFVKGAKVTVQIVQQIKDKKIRAFNYKPKKNERKRWGHRQPYTFLKVLEVIGG